MDWLFGQLFICNLVGLDKGNLNDNTVHSLHS